MKRTIRTAVIGVGSMGANHARVYAELDHCELVGVYDAAPAIAQQRAAQFHCSAFSSLEALHDAGVEAVTVAVPTTSHADVVLMALRQGLHVLVEKPIAASLAEAEHMVRVANSYRRVLMVGHVERFNPAIEAIRQAVDPAEILAINIMRVGPLPPRIRDAGVIIDLAVHDIDLVHHLTQDTVEAVYCVSSSSIARYEDAASILMRMSGGASAQITTNWVTPYKAREIQVITADKLVRANLLTQHVQACSRFSEDAGSYLVRDVYVRHQEPLRCELEAFLEAVRTGQQPPITGEDGARVLDVALRAVAFQTANRHSTPVAHAA
jgi:hypothetical protein